MVIELTWQEVWLPALIFLMCTGFVEEFIFRGVLQRTAVEAFGWRGIIYVSLLFAALHMGFLSLIDVVFVFCVALFFGWVVKKTGSLLGVALAHGITNIILYLVAPFFF
jgi:membrane protease YdiL (CAAX protease family)